MDSTPGASCSGTSTPKTGSPCGSTRSASAQSGLSAAASAAIVLKTSVAEEVANGLDGAVDVLVRVGERDEETLELRGRDVDPPLQQVAEERAVALRVARLRVL